MKAFAYVNAANQQEALAALSTATRGKRLPLAGGMDLIGLMKDYIIEPDVLVNVKKLPAMLFVPPLVTMFITPPLLRPYSAL